MRYVRTSRGTVFDTIQEGINDLRQDGGWVEVSVGNFQENLIIRHPSTTLRGQGYMTAVGNAVNSRPTILICGAAHQFAIKDIRIMNTSSGTAVFVSGATGGLFDSVHITDAGRDGIELYESTLTKINDCNIAHTDRHAISIINSCGVLVVKNYMGHDYISGSMVLISGGGGSIISNNLMTNFNANSGVGVMIGSPASTYTTVMGNRIAGFLRGIDDRGTSTFWSGLNNIS